jgi:tetratricopeptide (TPR) repeat protein
LKHGFRLLRLTPLLFSLAVANALAQPTGADSRSVSLASQHFAAGSAAFERQDNRLALAEFLAAIEAGSDGPAAHYNVAVCYYRLGEYEQAEQAFRALRRDFRKMQSLADYNIGLTLVRREAYSAARDAFERASFSDDEQIAALADAMLVRLPGGTGSGRSSGAWTQLVDIQFGDDDNVALIDPLSLPAELTTDSTFAEFQFYLGGPVREQSPWRIDASAFLIEYPSASDFDQSGVYVSARHEQQAGRWQLFIRPEFGRTNLDGNGFEQYVGLSLTLQQAFPSARTTFGIEVSRDSIDEVETQFAYIDGQRSVLELKADTRFDRSRLVIDYRIQSDDRVGAGVSADRDRYSLRYIRPLNPVWTGELRYEHRVSDYDRLLVPREESRHQAGIEARRELGAAWEIALRFQSAENDSTDSRFSYRRNRVSFGASRAF